REHIAPNAVRARRRDSKGFGAGKQDRPCHTRHLFEVRRRLGTYQVGPRLVREVLGKCAAPYTERLTAHAGEDAADVPAADNMVKKSRHVIRQRPSLAKWQLVYARHSQHMGAIKI